MRRVFMCGLMVVSLSLFWLNAAAQTPDEQTPAQESVCDVLKTDDAAPKGLYGLCVAYCEAQDADEIMAPADLITEEDVQAQLDLAPSERILNNFNRKAEGTDYVMPCLDIVDDNGCPCWNEEEITTIDGVGDISGEDIGTSCGYTGYPSNFYYVQEGAPERRFALVSPGTASIAPYCQYDDRNTGEFRNIFPITDEEYDACLASVQDQQVVLGVCP